MTVGSGRPSGQDDAWPEPRELYLVDSRRIDWEDQAFQELYEALLDGYPDTSDALALAEDSGVPRRSLNTGVAVDDLWRAILKTAARRGKLRQLVERAAEDPDAEAFWMSYARLLEQTLPRPSRSVRGWLKRSSAWQTVGVAIAALAILSGLGYGLYRLIVGGTCQPEPVRWQCRVDQTQDVTNSGHPWCGPSRQGRAYTEYRARIWRSDAAPDAPVELERFELELRAGLAQPDTDSCDTAEATPDPEVPPSIGVSLLDADGLSVVPDLTHHESHRAPFERLCPSVLPCRVDFVVCSADPQDRRVFPAVASLWVNVAGSPEVVSCERGGLDD